MALGLASWHGDQVPPTPPWHRLTMLIQLNQPPHALVRGTNEQPGYHHQLFLPEGVRCQQNCAIFGERSPKGSCSPLQSFSCSVTAHKPTLFLGECLSSHRYSLLRVGRSPIKHTRKILLVCPAFLGLLQLVSDVMEE